MKNFVKLTITLALFVWAFINVALLLGDPIDDTLAGFLLVKLLAVISILGELVVYALLRECDLLLRLSK